MKNRYDNLIERIKGGALVLTVNRRLSRHLGDTYDDYMVNSGAKGWTSPAILPITTWLNKLHEELIPDITILNAPRADALWRRLAPPISKTGRDLTAPGIAEIAYAAYTICAQYNVKLPEGIYRTDETEALTSWIEAYESGAAELGFIDPVRIPGVLSGLCMSKKEAFAQKIVLAGFDEPPPSILRFIEELKSAGAAIDYWHPTTTAAGITGKTEVLKFASMKDEVMHAARWARANAAPNKKIAFIVPDMYAYRDTIIHEFSAELDPASVIPWEQRMPRFNISLGAPLSSDPLVKSALDILSVHQGKNELQTLTAVLLSGYFAAGQDSLVLARIDADLKNDLRLGSSLNELQAKCERYGAKNLSKRFEDWGRILNELPKNAYPRQWAHAFTGLLKDTGWLAHAKLSSAEFQSFEAWSVLLENFATLDIPLNKITLSEALRQIKKTASQTIHQSETPDIDIEILGMLEATGLTFDKVWVMGCHEYALPAEPSPNPFIPPRIQKEYKLPRSTRESELKFAAERLKEALSSAPETIVSYPAQVDDRETGLTPLLRRLGTAAADKTVAQSSRFKDALLASGAGSVETIIDDDVIPFAENELAQVRGGTEILKNHSHCPFKAFAKHRLRAVDLPTPEYGLSTQIRGTILHKALKTLWDKINSSQRLKSAIDEENLLPLINQITEQVFKSINTDNAPRPLLDIEKKRLVKMLLNEARLETERGDFAVLKTEADTLISIAGLNIECKPDRLDLLPDGTQAVLDYKSGICSRNDWTTDRPKDPQLLIYALKFKASAVSFVTLTPGECAFVGTAVADKILPGVNSFEKDATYSKKFDGVSNWGELSRYWEKALSALSIDFQSGNALIDPIPSKTENDSVCARCSFDALCRIAERGDLITGDYDAED